jgi:hypothetical protein
MKAGKAGNYKKVRRGVDEEQRRAAKREAWATGAVSRRGNLFFEHRGLENKL